MREVIDVGSCREDGESAIYALSFEWPLLHVPSTHLITHQKLLYSELGLTSRCLLNICEIFRGQDTGK